MKRTWLKYISICLMLIVLCCGFSFALADGEETSADQQSKEAFRLNIEKTVILYDAEGNETAKLFPTDVPFEMMLILGEVSMNITAELIAGDIVSVNSTDGAIMELMHLRVTQLDPRVKEAGQTPSLDIDQYWIKLSDVWQTYADMTRSYFALTDMDKSSKEVATPVPMQQAYTNIPNEEPSTQQAELAESAAVPSQILDKFPSAFISAISLVVIAVLLCFGLAIYMKSLHNPKTADAPAEENGCKTENKSDNLNEKSSEYQEENHEETTEPLKDHEDAEKKSEDESQALRENGKSEPDAPPLPVSNKKSIPPDPQKQRYIDDIKFFNHIAKINKHDIWVNALKKNRYGHCLLKLDDPNLKRYVALLDEYPGSNLACVWNGKDQIPYLIPSCYDPTISSDDFEPFYDIDASAYKGGDASYRIIKCAKLGRAGVYYIFDDNDKGTMQKYTL